MMRQFILWLLIRWCESDITLLRDQLATMRRDLAELESRREHLHLRRMELESGRD